MNKEKIISLFSQAGCVSFSAAEEKDIQKINSDLISYELSPLPQDYKDFLLITNGFIYDGLEFFGTISHDRKEKNYIFSSIIDINIEFIEYQFFSDKLIVGKMSENLIIYDSTNNYYSIVDSINLCSQVEFSEFKDILKIILNLN